MTTTNGFGLTNWDEQNQTSKPQAQDDSTKIDFVRLKEGNNSIRIITAPAKYWFVKFDDGKSQYGRRVNCAYPAVDKNECPTVKAGYKPKKRYLTGVILRDISERPFDLKKEPNLILIHHTEKSSDLWKTNTD